MDIQKELRSIIAAFNQASIAYALFGGMAVAICVVSAEGLVSMKRRAGRDQDLLDIRMLGFEP